MVLIPFPLFLVLITQRALYEDNPNTDNCGNPDDILYLTLTVPCIKLSPSQNCFVTLSLMHDVDQDKRCFHCIFSSTPTIKVGEIVYIQQNVLMDML